MNAHEWTNRCIADDLELHPWKDPGEVTTYWRWRWYQQGRDWERQAKASRRRGEREAMAKLAAAAHRFGESCTRLGKATRGTAAALDSFGRAWNRLETS